VLNGPNAPEIIRSQQVVEAAQIISGNILQFKILEATKHAGV